MHIGNLAQLSLFPFCFHPRKFIRLSPHRTCSITSLGVREPRSCNQGRLSQAESRIRLLLPVLKALGLTYKGCMIQEPGRDLRTEHRHLSSGTIGWTSEQRVPEGESLIQTPVKMRPPPSSIFLNNENSHTCRKVHRTLYLLRTDYKANIHVLSTYINELLSII